MTHGLKAAELFLSDAIASAKNAQTALFEDCAVEIAADLGQHIDGLSRTLGMVRGHPAKEIATRASEMDAANA